MKEEKRINDTEEVKGEGENDKYAHRIATHRIFLYLDAIEDSIGKILEEMLKGERVPYIYIYICIQTSVKWNIKSPILLV